MSSYTPPTIYYPAPIDERHQGPKVTVTAALCLCFSAVFLATRLFTRWPWPKLFGLDDGAAIAASVSISNPLQDSSSQTDSPC
jgi:hypothetical protein